ncbi:MAG TPA: sugar ABC transporter permease [Symbiobacteriaceae bacterium]|jgi:multiple sugar transport system permease protein|nr:sugar ABC transporter permease [Symbiobacteriaceae bacterium]
MQVSSRAAQPSRKRRMPQWLEAAPFLLPGLLLFALFVFWPLLQGLRISFYQWSIMPGAEQKFVGLANYKKAFTDPVVRVAIRNTLLYVLVTVPGQMIIGLLVATGLNAAIRGKVFWRSLYYIPVLTSWVVVSYMFKYLFSGGGAPVNYIFKDVLHILPTYINWLQNEWTAQVPINLLGIWKGIGWTMVMFLAGLQGIPKELYEAAAIDGANRSRMFRHVTMPLLRPVILFVLVLLTIGGFGVFISVQLLTGGGPMNKTQVMISYMYDTGFKYFDFGYGFALAALMGVLIFAISFIQFKFVRGKTEY